MARSEKQAEHTRAIAQARRIDPDDYTVTMSIRIPHAMMERLRSAAAAEGLTLASWVRQTLGDAAETSTTYRPREAPRSRPATVPDVCPYCGNILLDNSVFCTSCGRKLPRAAGSCRRQGDGLCDITQSV